MDTVIGGVPTTTSVFHVSLSPDSSCSNELHNASAGFETLELYPISKFNKRKIKSKIRDLKRKLTVENTVPAAEEAQSDATRKPLGRLLFAGSKNGAIFRPFRSTLLYPSELRRLKSWFTCDIFHCCRKHSRWR